MKIYLNRYKLRQFIQRFAGLWVIIHVAFFIIGVFLIYHPEAGAGMKGHEISPVVEVFQIAGGLLAYWLAGKIRG